MNLRRNVGFFLILLLFPPVFGSIQNEIEKEEISLDNNLLDINYLNQASQNEYILQAGDVLSVQVKSSQTIVELRKKGIIQVITGEGKISLPFLNQVYVENLSVSELNSLLSKAYEEFINFPEVNVEVIEYRNIQVLVKGEVARPGVYSLDGALSLQSDDLIKGRTDTNYYFPTLFDVIRKAGGITPYSDLSKIIIIRKDTLSNGGGKKKTTIDFSDILSKGDNDKNLRMYDSDIVIISRLSEPNPESLKIAFSSNLNKKLVSVIVTGQVNTPGVVNISRTSTLNDAILFSGGKLLTSGKINFLRIDSSGEIDSRKVSYNKKAKRGSYSNPYLKDNDLILVGESIYGKSLTFLSVLTRPFSELLSAYGLIKAIESL